MPATIPTDLGAALAERYQLRDLLGRGGMATVYLAFDRKHQRLVALKALRPELAASLGAERFLKEIRIVAQLTHPHILPLHDSGESGGFLFYVMPYLGGGSLRQELERNGALGPERALAIAAPVADALAYAHRHGVLHRDVKPENILFSEGHPIVADFGIAKAVASASDTRVTHTGLALGTPGYMSPEQAAGLTELDERTDVYSLAVVVYEMVVGDIPGRWPSEAALRTGRFLEAPPAHRARLATAGSRIEEALLHGLAIQPELRTGSPDALVDELRGTAPPRRRFQAQEVEEIVRQAAELEAAQPTRGAMTLGGVEALAAEVGIAPELVRSAAKSVVEAGRGAGLAPLAPPARNRFLGGPTRLAYERVVDGELPDLEFPFVVEQIRRVMGNAGQVSQLGRSFSWTMGRSPLRRDVEVIVSVRAGRTRITVQEDLGQLITQVYGPIGGGMGVGGLGVLSAILGGVLHIPAAMAAAIPIWLTTTFATARTAYFYSARRRQRELERLADSLAAVVEEVNGASRRLAGPPRPS